jgi:hypothetical protein
MPYKLIPENSGLLIKWWGSATSSEMIRLQEEGHARPDFDNLHYSIHDFSECDHIVSSKEDLQYSAAIDRAASLSNKNILIALVSSNPEVLEAVDGYMGMGLSPYPIRVFSSMEGARAWVTLTY